MESEAVAIRILKNMQEKGILCHASGSAKEKFTHGFYFYYMHPNPKEKVPYNRNYEIFKNDWVEIEFNAKDSTTKFEPLQSPEFLHGTMSRYAARQRRKEFLSRTDFYNTVTLDVDSGSKSDRKEWGHLKYQHYYEPR